jgi:hypothetical protein
MAINAQYGKDDSIRVGVITPTHISPQGDFRLMLVPSDVTERHTGDQTGEQRRAAAKRKTGYAWFNYAVITPVPVVGRINANTADERLWRAMPGVSATLARNLANGIGAGHRKRIKPYRAVGDLLDVDGMTPDVFERIANMLALKTSTYTIEARVEAVQDVNNDKIIDEDKGDKILASRHMRYVLRFNPGMLGQDSMTVLERYAP